LYVLFKIQYLHDIGSNLTRSCKMCQILICTESQRKPGHVWREWANWHEFVDVAEISTAIGTRGLRPQFILGKHGLGFLGCGVSLPKSEFSAPLSSHILDFYTELMSTHLEADVQRLGVRISSQFFLSMMK